MILDLSQGRERGKVQGIERVPARMSKQTKGGRVIAEPLSCVDGVQELEEGVAILASRHT